MCEHVCVFGCLWSLENSLGQESSSKIYSHILSPKTPTMGSEEIMKGKDRGNHKESGIGSLCPDMEKPQHSRNSLCFSYIVEPGCGVIAYSRTRRQGYCT